jgi:hypothetical protein
METKPCSLMYVIAFSFEKLVLITTNTAVLYWFMLVYDMLQACP